MPRRMPTGLPELMSMATAWAETHSLLRLETKQGTFHLATARLKVDEIDFVPTLQDSAQLKQSITQAVDRVEVGIENVDFSFGLKFVTVIDALHGARATFGRYWRDLRNGAEYHKWLLNGVIIAAPGDEELVRLTIFNELYASRQIAGRLVTRNCQWRYKEPATCGYVGPLLTCNKLLDSPDGCQGRARQHRYSGFVYIQ